MQSPKKTAKRNNFDHLHKVTTGQHISHLFDHDIVAIKTSMTTLSGVVESQFLMILEALRAQKDEVLSQMGKKNTEVDDLTAKLEKQCTEVLALRQPRAIDLRLIIAVSHMATSLERVGNVLEEVARYTLKLYRHDKDLGESLQDALGLFEVCYDMLKDAIDSFVRLDADSAMKVIHKDQDLRSKHKNTTRVLISQMLEDPSAIRGSLNLMWALGGIVQVGENIRDIASYVVFIEKGNNIFQAHPPSESDPSKTSH